MSWFLALVCSAHWTGDRSRLDFQEKLCSKIWSVEKWITPQEFHSSVGKDLGSKGFSLSLFWCLTCRWGSLHVPDVSVGWLGGPRLFYGNLSIYYLQVFQTVTLSPVSSSQLVSHRNSARISASNAIQQQQTAWHFFMSRRSHEGFISNSIIKQWYYIWGKINIGIRTSSYSIKEVYCHNTEKDSPAFFWAQGLS